MVKPEWGNRRMCQSCATPFYDLLKNPIVCPTCQTSYELVSSSKGRRGRQSVIHDGKNAAIDDLTLQDNLDLGADLVDDADLIEETDDLDDEIGNMSDVLGHNEDEH